MGVSTVAMSFSLVILVTIISSISADLSGTGYKLMKKVYDQCDRSDDIVKCFKFQALKLANRAVHSTSFKIFDGVFIVQDETSRAMSDSIPQLSDEQLESLESNQIDNLLSETTDKFLETHRVKLDIPKLVEEGRGRIRRIIGPLLAAIAIKGGMMAMAMKGIAMMAGMALMMGKMALMLSSIIGLKKLLGGGDKEKTTVEIVKHPQISYGSLDSNDITEAQDIVYNAHVPGTRR
ncbi:Osiris 11 [Carabus blaptoides fortunei]